MAVMANIVAPAPAALAPEPKPAAASLRGAATPQSAEAKARYAAEEFEAVYLSIMFSSMFTGLTSKGPFGGGAGEQMYRAQLYDELGRSMARSGGIGIADAVYREIMRHQEV